MIQENIFVQRKVALKYLGRKGHDPHLLSNPSENSYNRVCQYVRAHARVFVCVWREREREAGGAGERMSKATWQNINNW